MEPVQKIPYRTENHLNPPSLSELHIHGSIGDQMETFFHERIFSDYARNTIYAETEEQFRIVDDDKSCIGMWRGEFWGKWVISACRAARYEHDDDMKEFLHAAAHRMLSLMREDGYLGTYRDPENYFACDPARALAEEGHESNWNWNIWCRKYTLWGLLECYDLTGDETILTGAARTADQLIAMLQKNGVRIGDTGTFCGMPSCSILKPMLLLYERTGVQRYLDFACGIADDWERPDGKQPNLIANALSGKPVHTWYPRPEKWAKAYEMMSCFDGIVELYRVTGVSRYLTAAERFYEELNAGELNLLFSVGYNDQFANGANTQNCLTEPCDIIHWIRLCYELYLLTGNIRYVETIERAYYNPFLAGAYRDGKWGARCVRSAGRPRTAHGQSSMQYSHCCVNNMPRGFLNVCELFSVTDGKDVYCNLYTEYDGVIHTKDQTVRIGITGTYLRDGRCTVATEAESPLTLHLRIPAWSRRTVIDGAVISASGCYYEVSIPAGRTEISLQFDMQITLREPGHDPVNYPKTDFHYYRFFDGDRMPDSVLAQNRRATLLYGPLLLARSKAVGCTEDEMFSDETVCGGGYDCTVTPFDTDAVRCGFHVTMTNGTDEKQFTMCDLATGANRASEDDPLFYTIFL